MVKHTKIQIGTVVGLDETDFEKTLFTLEWLF